MDNEAKARGEGPDDKTLDQDFRSGVLLGVGVSNMILSLMPSRLLSIVELFGFKGDRLEGLKLLYQAGGWSHDSPEPTVGAGERICGPYCLRRLIRFLYFS